MTDQSIPCAPPFTGLLEEALRSPDSVVRARAAQALGRKRWDATSAVPALTSVSLEDDDSSVRAAARTALIRLQVPAVAVRENALALQSHPSRDVRAYALWAIGRLEPADIEPAIPALDVCLATDSDPDPKFSVLWVFDRMRSADPSVLAILERTLGDPDGDVRSEAARVLGQIGRDAGVTVLRLSEVLADPDPLARGNAARAIGLIGTTDADVRERLRASCADTMDYVRAAAAESLRLLGEIPPDPPEVNLEDPWFAEAPSVDELVTRLEDESWYCRAEAAWLLAKCGARGEVASDALARQAVVDPDSVARWSALWALTRIGQPSRELTETLANILADDVDTDVRQSAAEALTVHWRKDPDVAIAALVAALRDEDPMTRDVAADSLLRIGPPAEASRSALEAALDDPHTGVRTRVASALAALGSEGMAANASRT